MNTYQNTFAALGLLLALSPAALAQEATTDGSTTETEAPVAEQPAADPAAGLDLGTAQQPEVYLREQHGVFEIRCVRGTGADQEPCQIVVALADEGGNPTAELSLFRLPDGSQARAGGIIATPLETLLTEGLRIAIDGGTPLVYQFTWCDPRGCYARIGLTDQVVDAFKRGAAAEIILVPVGASDQRVVLPMSLSGFTAAYDSLDVPAQ